MELSRVIIKPYLTEKAYAARGDEKKKFAFIVDMKATKNDISLAFQTIFEIEPEDITTQIRKPSKTRTGSLHPGYKKAKKIAYITLAKGQDISLSQEEFENKGDINNLDEAPLIEKDAKGTIAEKQVVKGDNEAVAVKAEAKKEAWKKSTNKNY